jgi:hypothetical protein
VSYKKIYVNVGETLFLSNESIQEFTILNISPLKTEIRVGNKLVTVNSSEQTNEDNSYQNTDIDCDDYDFYIGKAYISDIRYKGRDEVELDFTKYEDDLFYYAILKNNLEVYADFINTNIENFKIAYEESTQLTGSEALPRFQEFLQSEINKKEIGATNATKTRAIIDLVYLCLKAKQPITEKRLKFMYNSINRGNTQLNVLQIEELGLIDYSLFASRESMLFRGFF